MKSVKDVWLAEQIAECASHILFRKIEHALVKPVRLWEATNDNPNPIDYVFVTADGRMYNVEGGMIRQNFGYDFELMHEFVGRGLFMEVTL